MFEPDDRDYYSARANDASARGSQASNPRVAAIHYELAYRYSLLTGETSVERTELKLRHQWRRSA